MGRKTIKQWERWAFLVHATGTSLREIKLILAERGLRVSHEHIRKAIKKIKEVAETAIDNKKDSAI